MADATVIEKNDTEISADARLDRLEKGIDTLTTLVKEAAVAPKAPEAPAIRKGEDPLSSRPYSYGRMMLAVLRKNEGDSDFGSHSKIELEMAAKLRKESDAMCGAGGSGYSQFCAPVASAFMPQSWADADIKDNKGDSLDLPGYSRELVKEVRDHFACSVHLDADEVNRLGIRKDLVRNDATLGGALIPLAAQGELIEVLRNSMALTRVPGVRMVPLPPQGSIRYPRQTSLTTISAYTEGVAVSESNLNFGSVSLNAKKYAGLVDVTEELLKFAGNASVEALIRQDLAEQTARVTDKDMLEGVGGTNILGLANIPSIQSRVASTNGATGDTLWPEDIQLLISQMAGANAPIDRGVAVIMRPELWGSITTARDANGGFLFQWAFENGSMPSTLLGRPVILSTNVPNDRIESSATNLTMVFVVVPSEILIGQSGVMDFSMTDSDASKFQAGIRTVRCVTYLDMGVRHEASIGLTDKIAGVRTGS